MDEMPPRHLELHHYVSKVLSLTPDYNSYSLDLAWSLDMTTYNDAMVTADPDAETLNALVTACCCSCEIHVL
jgi:hypothetical protein